MALDIQRGIIFKAQKVVVYGPEGIGKSTFAARFPEPLFIDTEGSTNLLDVSRLKKPNSWSMLLQQVDEIRRTPGCCKTLVIDTVDWAEHLCTAHVCAAAGKVGIEDFGYGKGYVYVKEEFGKLLNLLIDVTEAGINVVLTAHSIMRKFERPDEAGAYDRYELKLGNKAGSQISALVKEWADMLLFVNYKEMVVEVNGKKKAQGGKRIMYTQHHPCWDAKNRHEFKDELPFDYQQIAYAIPNDPINTPAAPEEKTDTKEITKEPPKAPTPDAVKKEPVAAAEKKSKPAAPAKKDNMPDAKDSVWDGVDPKLVNLMEMNNVTPEEIQEVVTLRGYFPKGTPIKNYPADFVDGCLVGAWEQVFQMVKDSRNVPF